MPRLEQWSCGHGTPEEQYIASYQPPEHRRLYLRGHVFGHPKFPDNHPIISTYIVNVDGRFITTYSGTVYELGEPEPEYIAYCKENGCHIPTQEEPVRCVSRKDQENHQSLKLTAVTPC